MLDIPEYTETEQKNILILFRAIHDHPRDDIQGTIRYYFPRVPADGIATSMRDEWERARFWWEYLEAEERNKLETLSRFATHCI